MKNLGYLSAIAVTTSLAMGSTTTHAADEGGWEFSVAPMYLWGKAIDADASAGGNALPLDLEFKDDILENLDAAFAIHFEAQKEKIGLFFEYNFARLDPSADIPGLPFDVRYDVEFEDTMIEGGASWAFAETGSTRWEVLGGLRYYDQEIDVEFNSSGPAGIFPTRVEAGDSWVTPFAGIRTMTELSERWSMRVRLDYGYEGSDSSALHGLFFFDYRFRNWGSAFIGYRYLDIDYDNTSSGMNQYGFDGDQQGPTIGLNLYF